MLPPWICWNTFWKPDQACRFQSKWQSSIYASIYPCLSQIAVPGVHWYGHYCNFCRYKTQNINGPIICNVGAAGFWVHTVSSTRSVQAGSLLAMRETCSAIPAPLLDMNFPPPRPLLPPNTSSPSPKCPSFISPPLSEAPALPVAGQDTVPTRQPCQHCVLPLQQFYNRGRMRQKRGVPDAWKEVEGVCVSLTHQVWLT